MRSLPVAEPGTPDSRSPTRYLLWLARTQAGTLTYASAVATVITLADVLVPALLGWVVDAIAARDADLLVRMTALLLACAAAGSTFQIVMHRADVSNWLQVAYRTVQVVTRHAGFLGATLRRRFSTGEVVAIGTTDVEAIGLIAVRITKAVGAVLAIVVVSGILLSIEPRLGLLVLVGTPAIVLALGPLLRPFHRRQARLRESQGDLSARATDIATGLRVLRGIGGERLFADRYIHRSQEVRAAAVRVGRFEAVIRALRRTLPLLLTAAVAGVGAHLALAGAITPGQLVAFYAYTAFLTIPVADLMDTVESAIGAHVAARRVVRILQVSPEVLEPARPARAPTDLTGVEDTASGVVARRGALIGVAVADAGAATALAERLARYRDDEHGEVLLHGADTEPVRLRDLPIAETRRLVLLSDNDAELFSGTLREELAPDTETPEERVRAALHAASADDVVTALPGGMDGEVVERGIEFSGGQRQRLRLARALLVDPEVLVLVEPASAVDAHTEAVIAERLRAARAGRTTIVITGSPLLLDHADEVQFLADGVVAARGRHHELAASVPDYARAVLRDDDLSPEVSA